MKKWNLLVDLSFDWSSGEYENQLVENVFLKFFECETEEEAVIECRKEFAKRFEEDNGSCSGFHYTYGQADYFKALRV